MKSLLLATCVPALLLLSACGKMTVKGLDPIPMTQTTETLENKNLALCSSEEQENIKLAVIPDHKYEPGELKSLVERTGPMMKQVFAKLNAEEKQELAGVTTKTEGGITCARYQPTENVEGKTTVANCVVHTCTFAERAQ